VRPFQARAIRAIGILRYDRWRLRTYSILAAPLANPLHAFRTAIDRLLPMLPMPPATAKRLGVGFLILHHGRDADYAVLGWWDNENEMPLRLLLRDHGKRTRWRRPKPQESVCVWDLEVIWAERNAYVEGALVAGTRNPAERYAYSGSPFLPRGAWRELRLEDASAR
jgi:hypothetical protein